MYVSVHVIHFLICRSGLLPIPLCSRCPEMPFQPYVGRTLMQPESLRTQVLPNTHTTRRESGENAIV